jgi:ribonucleotide reductase beta subunit family protein with ferritin-like domain
MAENDDTPAVPDESDDLTGATLIPPEFVGTTRMAEEGEEPTEGLPVAEEALTQREKEKRAKEALYGSATRFKVSGKWINTSDFYQNLKTGFLLCTSYFMSHGLTTKYDLYGSSDEEVVRELSKEFDLGYNSSVGPDWFSAPFTPVDREDSQRTKAYPFGRPWRLWERQTQPGWLKQIETGAGDSSPPPEKVDLWSARKGGVLPDETGFRENENLQEASQTWSYIPGSPEVGDESAIDAQNWERRYNNLVEEHGGKDEDGAPPPRAIEIWYTEVELAWRLAQLNSAIAPMLQTTLYRRTQTRTNAPRVHGLTAKEVLVMSPLDSDQFRDLTETSGPGGALTLEEAETRPGLRPGLIAGGVEKRPNLQQSNWRGEKAPGYYDPTYTSDKHSVTAPNLSAQMDPFHMARQTGERPVVRGLIQRESYTPGQTDEGGYVQSAPHSTLEDRTLNATQAEALALTEIGNYVDAPGFARSFFADERRMECVIDEVATEFMAGVGTAMYQIDTCYATWRFDQFNMPYPCAVTTTIDRDKEDVVAHNPMGTTQWYDPLHPELPADSTARAAYPTEPSLMGPQPYVPSELEDFSSYKWGPMFWDRDEFLELHATTLADNQGRTQEDVWYSVDNWFEWKAAVEQSWAGIQKEPYYREYQSWLWALMERIEVCLKRLKLIALADMFDASGDQEKNRMDEVLGLLGGSEKGATAGKSTYTDVPREAASSFDQQCFLLENIRLLSYAASKRTYPNFGLLAGQPGNLVSRLNHGSMSNAAVTEILNITPDVFALLEPHIRLTRVRYGKNAEDGEGDGPLVPMGEDILPFESYTSKKDIDLIFKNRSGRQAGAGIKSFEWTLQGVQPAEVDNNITATLVVHFQSLHDLFRYNLYEGGTAAGAGQIRPDGVAGFLDLIIAPETVKPAQAQDPEVKTEKPKPCGVEVNAYKGVYYRIKAEVGWAIPDGLRNHPGITEQQATNLATALSYQRKTLFLQLARHGIDFQQDGSLTLTVEYQAALESTLKSQRANLFGNMLSFESSPLYEAVRESREAYQSTKESKAEGQATESMLEQALEEYDTAFTAYQNVTRQDKMQTYSQVLHAIFGDENTAARMYVIRVGMDQVLTDWGKMDAKERRTAAKKRQTGELFEKREGEKGGLDPVLFDLFNNGGADDEDEWKETMNHVGSQLNTIGGATPTDTVDIHYFYFGDLIYSILSIPHIAQLVDKKAFQILLGTLQMFDPLVAYQMPALGDMLKCSDPRNIDASIARNGLPAQGVVGIYEHFDIASIPISLDLFSEWFLQNVIKKGREKYYVLHFIKDVLAGLVSVAMNSSCFTGLPSTPTRFATSDVLLKKPVINKRVTLDQILGGGTAGQSSTSQSWIVPRNERYSLLPRTRTGTMGPPIPTYVVYCSDSRPVGTGKAVEDINNGIYHFNLGASAGLVKTIQFQREDQPFLRESKIQRHGALGAEQLRELYKVDMSMIGNTLLKNGQFIYINPVAIGSGIPFGTGMSSLDYATTIGLGGYFLVTGVTHTISDAGFDVTISALHQAMRDANEATVGVSPDEVPVDPDPGSPEAAGEEEEEKGAKEEKAPEPDEEAVTKAPVATDEGGSSQAGGSAGLAGLHVGFIPAEGLGIADLDCSDPDVNCEEYELTFGSEEDVDDAMRTVYEDKIAAWNERGYDNLSPGEQLMYERYQEQLETGEY